MPLLSVRMIVRNNTVDDEKVARFKAQGLSNAIIARRLGVTQGAIYQSIKRHKPKNEIDERINQRESNE